VFATSLFVNIFLPDRLNLQLSFLEVILQITVASNQIKPLSFLYFEKRFDYVCLLFEVVSIVSKKFN